MTRKTTPGKQDRVTLREFRTAFNKVVPRPFFAELRDEVIATFPSAKPDASVTVKKFLDNINSVLDVKKGRKIDFTKPHHHGSQTLLNVIHEMPTLKKAFAKEQVVAEARRKRQVKARRRNARDVRIESLERENERLRADENRRRPPSAEEEARVRKWYEDNDTRIGGDRNPGPGPGFRD
ncbi:MAG: hypothetical protein ACAH83_20270 [Alphaproteobacteria bacterium]